SRSDRLYPLHAPAQGRRRQHRCPVRTLMLSASNKRSRGGRPVAAPRGPLRLQPPSAAGLQLVSSAPAPGARTEAAGDNAFAIDVRDHVAVAGEERLGRAHLRTEGKLAFGETVAAVLLEFGGAVRLLRAAGAEGALVH